MGIELLVAPSIPILKPTDTVGNALSIMEEQYFNQLPLVAEDEYIALINESELFNFENQDTPLFESEFRNFKPIVPTNAHPFEALRLFNLMSLSILPVVDIDNKYIGSITKDTLLNYFAENTGINTQGGLIVLEILPRNYTLYEIARICENEDMIITHASLRTTIDGMLEVTLKLNRSIIDAVVASFERHKYIVKEVYGVKNNNDDLTDNYNLLMNYLKM